MEGAREAGLEVEKVFLKDLKINYCTGCNRCYNGEHPCPQRDDAAGVLEKMVAADVIVMATPVYFYTVCGQMKTLIDRCCARYTEMTDKEFYFILTAAEESIPIRRAAQTGNSLTPRIRPLPSEGLFLPNVNFCPAASAYLCTPKNEPYERQY